MERTNYREQLRDVAPLAGSAAILGASFGAIAVAAGLPLWMACAMSVLVFAGGSQFLVVGVIAAGGGAIAAVAGGLILNARHLPFGLAVGDALDGGWLKRLVGSHLLVDESTAFYLAAPDPHRARAAYWASGVSLFVTWNLGTLAGAFAGQAISDPKMFGLDAAFPAALLALVLPRLKEAPVLRASVLGAVIAVATTPFLPGGVPVLLALLGLVAALPVPKREAAA
ncbi:AzlC family protein [Stackebrandtia nassauensis DSM 44728]|uniref:AzlC family protein n=2 Tax=Stackebrandtia TaxID=283810 RepID=D3Q0L1_STANL|nr:AzlC family ABC transporter permease [Stackebrandtia nassauensis]ADD41747.1 AzlC family protein [Stackebrandtia nassauensis DSM 44728]